MDYANSSTAIHVPRSPLSERVNSSCRRTRWVNKDSDDSTPSLHSSILDAARLPHCDGMKRTLPAAQIRSEDLRCESPLSRLESATPFLYGRGTELHPIVEQRSIASLSTSDLSSLMHSALGTHSKAENIIPLQGDHDGGGNSHGLRRRRSFSLDDLRPINLRKRGTPPASTSLELHVGDTLREYPRHPRYSPPQFANWIIHDSASRNNRHAGSSRGQRSGHGDTSAHPWVRLVQQSPPWSSSNRNMAAQRQATAGQQQSLGRRNPVTEARDATSFDGTLTLSYNPPPPLWECKKCHRAVKEKWSL